jgi:IS4 transposase
VQLVFVRQLSRHKKVLRSFVLVCTDVQFAPAAVLEAYLLRWRIEVAYREVKQNHAFGRTLSTELEQVYGQLVLSFLAYTCLSVTRLLTARLQDKTLGWIKREYFNALVEFRIAVDGSLTILFPPWLLDSYGWPEYDTLC